MSSRALRGNAAKGIAIRELAGTGTSRKGASLMTKRNAARRELNERCPS